MDAILGIADRVILAFQPLLSLPPERLNEVGVKVPIPTFDPKSIEDLTARTKETFQTLDTLMELPVPIYIVGDLHGNIFDLIRVLVMAGAPPLNRFLFLGDYVDRGQYSVEIIALLFAFQAKYPQHMYLIRGNHEFERVNSTYGFKHEVETLYKEEGPRLYELINDCFNYMPLAALISNQIFCVHGGISPQISSWRQLKMIKRPIISYDNNIASDLTWSDPDADTKEYFRSTRGNGVTFGKKAVVDFQKAFKVKHIIRAHQCVDLGIERFAGDVVYTVFSCSNYQDAGDNKCGLIYITPESTVQSFSLPAITQVPRERALLTGDLVGKEKETIGSQLANIHGSASRRGSILCLNQSPSLAGFAKKKVNKSAMNVATKFQLQTTRGTKPVLWRPLNEQRVLRPATSEPFQAHRLVPIEVEEILDSESEASL